MSPEKFYKDQMAENFTQQSAFDLFSQYAGTSGTGSLATIEFEKMMLKYRTDLAIAEFEAMEKAGIALPKGWRKIMMQGSVDAIADLEKDLAQPFKDLFNSLTDNIEAILGTRDLDKRIAEADKLFYSTAFDDDDYLTNAYELRDLILERYNIEKSEIEGIINAWQGVADSVSDQLLGMMTSSDNPRDIYERLGLQLDEVNRLQGLYGSTTGLEQAGYGGDLSTALGDYLKLSQEAYQRPSSEYQAIFEMVTSELRMIQDNAMTQVTFAENQLITLQDQTVTQLGLIRTEINGVVTAITGMSLDVADIEASARSVAGTVEGDTIKTSEQKQIANTFNISVVVNDNDLIDLKSGGTTTSTIIESIKYAIENGPLRAPIQEVANG